MIDIHKAKVWPRPEHQPRLYPSGLRPLLQSLLATLADLDFSFEQERERIVRSTSDFEARIRSLEKLKAQHRERRKPYIQQLALLQGEIERLLH